MRDDELARWADLARGVLSESDARTLEQELEGNTEAQRALAGFRALDEAASAEGAPPGAVALAKSLALLPGSDTGRRRVPIPFRVIFDSLATPLVAGHRSGLSPSRELHLEADHLFVDVRVDRARDSRSAVVVGEVLGVEVLGGEETREPLRDVAVRVVAEGEVLGETCSGDFGEFYLDLPFRHDMVLSMTVNERSFLSVDLSQPAAGAEEQDGA